MLILCATAYFSTTYQLGYISPSSTPYVCLKVSQSSSNSFLALFASCAQSIASFRSFFFVFLSCFVGTFTPSAPAALFTSITYLPVFNELDFYRLLIFLPAAVRRLPAAPLTRYLNSLHFCCSVLLKTTVLFDTTSVCLPAYLFVWPSHWPVSLVGSSMRCLFVCFVFCLRFFFLRLIY